MLPYVQIIVVTASAWGRPSRWERWEADRKT